MINKQSFSQVAKRVRRTGRGLRDPQLMHPNREWGIGLLVAVLIFTISAVWSAQTYMKYKDASINLVEPVTENMQVYRAAMIDAALEKFSERQAANELFTKRVAAERVMNEEAEEGGGGQATTTVENVSEEDKVNTATTSEEGVEEFFEVR